MIPNKLCVINISCVVFLRLFFPAVAVVSASTTKQRGQVVSTIPATATIPTATNEQDEEREQRDQHGQGKHRSNKKKTQQQQQERLQWLQQEHSSVKFLGSGHPWSHHVPSPPHTFPWCDQVQPVLPCCGGTYSPPKQLALVRLTTAKSLHCINQLGKCIDTARSSICWSTNMSIGKFVQKLR